VSIVSGIYRLIYVDLKNPVESVVSLDDERVLIRSVDCRLLGARVYINRKSCSSACGLQTAWCFGDASRHEPGLALRIQSHGFGYPFAAPALGCKSADF